MIETVVVATIANAAGEVLRRTGNLPASRPVLELLILLICFVALRSMRATIDHGSRPMLPRVPLLVVPGGAGLIAQLSLIARERPTILGAVVLSTAAVIAAALLTVRTVPRLGCVLRRASASVESAAW